jgi:hypothetical protein
MSTARQIAANQANALKSTGPKTAEGQERAKMNALKHGLTAREVTSANESVDDFNAYYDEFIEMLRPVGAIEEQLAERIIICAWRLRRVYRIDSSLFVAGQSVTQYVGSVGGVFVRLAGGDAISKLTRYEAAIERSYQRARQELERLQARRRGEAAVAGRHN